VNEGELRPEIDSVIQTLEVGGISEPIQVPGGVYIVVLADKRVSKPDTLYKIQQIRSDINEDDGGFDTAKSRVEQALTSVSSCDNLKNDLENSDGVTNLDMGELKETEMNELIIGALNGVDVGQGSAPVEGPGVAVSFFICEKSLTGENIPTRNQIEDRLIDQQIAQASKRHLRDLRRDAAISIR